MWFRMSGACCFSCVTDLDGQRPKVGPRFGVRIPCREWLHTVPDVEGRGGGGGGGGEGGGRGGGPLSVPDGGPF